MLKIFESLISDFLASKTTGLPAFLYPKKSTFGYFLEFKNA
jgi:hypothetical protein